MYSRQIAIKNQQSICPADFVIMTHILCLFFFYFSSDNPMSLIIFLCHLNQHFYPCQEHVQTRQSDFYTLRSTLLESHKMLLLYFQECNDYFWYSSLTLLKLQRQITQRHSVCGYDNLLYSKLLPLSITTVDNHLGQRAESAFELLQRNIDIHSNKPDVNFKNAQIKIAHPSILIVRKSTGTAKEV